MNYSFNLKRFAKVFNVKLEFKIHLFKIFSNLIDWFLINKSGINFLGLKTKLTLICNNDKGFMQSCSQSFYSTVLKAFVEEYIISHI